MSGQIAPRNSTAYETMATPSVIPSAGTSAVERGRRRESHRPERHEQQDRVRPGRRQLDRLQLVGDAEEDRPGHDPRAVPGQGDDHEQHGRGERRQVEPAARDRAGQDHLQGAPLALPGDRGHRVADREDRHERDRDRVDEAQGDRAAQGEDVAPGERREELEEVGEVAALHEPPEVRPEGRVDDRQQEAPQAEPRRDGQEPPAGRRDGPPQEHPAHGAVPDGPGVADGPGRGPRPRRLPGAAASAAPSS